MFANHQLYTSPHQRTVFVAFALRFSTLFLAYFPIPLLLSISFNFAFCILVFLADFSVYSFISVIIFERNTYLKN